MTNTSPLTQDTYRLWARIGAGNSGTGFRSTPGLVLVTNSNQSVVDQLAALAVLSVTMEQY
jgi:5-enolpyruvylshikimate-3-phosphate synthase